MVHGPLSVHVSIMRALLSQSRSAPTPLLQVGVGIGACLLMACTTLAYVVHARRRRHGSPSWSEWREARRLLELQPHLHELLEKQFHGFPISGLYADEQDMRDGTTFADFLAHVRTRLADSPRNLLLRSLDLRLAELRDEARQALQELCEMLGVAPSTTAPLRIATLAEAVLNVSKGFLHHQWSLALAQCQKAPGLDDPMRRQRAVDGLVRSKRSNRPPPPPPSFSFRPCPGVLTPADPMARALFLQAAKHRAKGWPEPSRAQVDAMIARSAAAAAEAHAAASLREASLRERLDSDEAWRRHQRVHALWAESGAAGLWREYTVLDAAEGRERRHRGGAFESERARSVFAMLVDRLHAERGLSRRDFWYRCGAAWLDGRGKVLGEIDLVLMHGPAVCAILEMKSGCFEVAAAMRQHEPKLAAAAAAAAAMTPQDERHAGAGQSQRRCRGADASSHVCIAETTDWRSARLPLPADGSVPPVYVATLIPPHPFVIGAEPDLTRAVCDACFCAPHAAGACPEAASGHPSPAEVEASVRERMGADRLSLSPLGCLRQQAERILVVGAPLDVSLDSRAAWRAHTHAQLQ